MDTPELAVDQQIAKAASAFQHQQTGHAPSAVSVVVGDGTLVITLHDALSPAEKALAESPAGAAQVQEYHRQLFTSSSEPLRQEIKRITGLEVREASAEVDPSSGTVVCAFASGTMVQVFQLDKSMPAETLVGGGVG